MCIMYMCLYLQESVYEYDIDEYIMGMASQIAEREDNIITPDLRGQLFFMSQIQRLSPMCYLPNLPNGRTKIPKWMPGSGCIYISLE